MNRHDLCNSVVVIKRLIEFSKPIIEKLVDYCSNRSEQEIPAAKLEKLTQALNLLELEIKKLSESCKTLFDDK